MKKTEYIQAARDALREIEREFNCSVVMTRGQPPLGSREVKTSRVMKKIANPLATAWFLLWLPLILVCFGLFYIFFLIGGAFLIWTSPGHRFLRWLE